MRYEWDKAKNAANKTKHGVGFEEAERLEATRVIPDVRRAYGEQRLTLYGLIGGRLHVAAITFRGDVCRIISLRKANKREVRYYAQTTQTND